MYVYVRTSNLSSLSRPEPPVLHVNVRSGLRAPRPARRAGASPHVVIVNAYRGLEPVFLKTEYSNSEQVVNVCSNTAHRTDVITGGCSRHCFKLRCFTALVIDTTLYGPRFGVGMPIRRFIASSVEQARMPNYDP